VHWSNEFNVRCTWATRGILRCRSNVLQQCLQHFTLITSTLQCVAQVLIARGARRMSSGAGVASQQQWVFLNCMWPIPTAWYLCCQVAGMSRKQFARRTDEIYVTEVHSLVWLRDVALNTTECPTRCIATERQRDNRKTERQRKTQTSLGFKKATSIELVISHVNESCLIQTSHVCASRQSEKWVLHSFRKSILASIQTSLEFVYEWLMSRCVSHSWMRHVSMSFMNDSYLDERSFLIFLLVFQ